MLALHLSQECFAFFSPTPDEDPASTSLIEEVLGVMLDVGDLEYEDKDTSSDDEEGGVRRYLRANGMGRRLPKMPKKTGYTLPQVLFFVLLFILLFSLFLDFLLRFWPERGVSAS